MNKTKKPFVELDARQLRQVTGGNEEPSPETSEENQDGQTYDLLTGAVQRASGNGRKTVRAYDL